MLTALLIFTFIFTIKIMADTSLTVEEILAVKDQVAKIATETSATLAKVVALEEALANAGGVSPEVRAAFEELKAQVILVDELIPDAPVDPVVE
jgi:hypothetical protein